MHSYVAYQPLFETVFLTERLRLAFTRPGWNGRTQASCLRASYRCAHTAKKEPWNPQPEHE